MQELQRKFRGRVFQKILQARFMAEQNADIALLEELQQRRTTLQLATPLVGSSGVSLAQLEKKAALLKSRYINGIKFRFELSRVGIYRNFETCWVGLEKFSRNAENIQDIKWICMLFLSLGCYLGDQTRTFYVCLFFCLHLISINLRSLIARGSQLMTLIYFRWDLRKGYWTGLENGWVQMLWRRRKVDW